LGATGPDSTGTIHENLS